ncbi:MAG: hypothetical protein WBN94_00060 [Methanothrix sp.]
MASCTNGSNRMPGDGHYLFNITLAREINALCHTTGVFRIDASQI